MQNAQDTSSTLGQHIIDNTLCVVQRYHEKINLMLYIKKRRSTLNLDNSEPQSKKPKPSKAEYLLQVGVKEK